MSEMTPTTKTADKFVLQLPRDGIRLKTIERRAIVAALKLNKWVQKDAARFLGISSRVLAYKMKAHGIEGRVIERCRIRQFVREQPG